MKQQGVKKTDKIVKPQAGFQNLFAASSVDVVFGGGILAAGKAILLSELCCTPFGFRKIGDLQAGDIISNPNTGKQQRVLQLHPIETREYFRISFDDGTYVDASGEHLWKVRTSNYATTKCNNLSYKDDWRIWDTRKMYAWMKDREDNGITENHNLLIPLTAPVQFNRPVTPTTTLPPYILGVLLRDGCMSENIDKESYVLLTTPDDFIAERFVEYGYDMSHFTDCGTCKAYRIENKNIANDIKTLKLDGHTAIDKFIPTAYKHATIEERKQLMQGLIDAGGTIDSKNSISYCTISRQLAEDVAWVARSLGAWASITTKQGRYKDGQEKWHECKLAYIVTIQSDMATELVSLPRKACRVKNSFNGNKGEKCKAVTKIESIGLQEGRCITVDDPSGLFITNDFTVTHNSFALVLAMAEPLMTDPDFRAVISRKAIGSLKAGGGFVDTFKDIFGDQVTIRQTDSPRASFKSGAFCDLTYIDDSNMDKLRERAKGWQYDMIAMDELTEMTWEAFSYLMTRNRGRSKTFTGHFFATMNPKRSHWTRTFIDWYIGEDGYIRPDRDGKVRYFYVNGSNVEDVVWGNSKYEVYSKCKIDIDRKLKHIGGKFSYKDMIKSFVFYKGALSENKALVGGNSGYVGSIAASGGKTAQALIEGNWNVDPDEEEEIPIPSSCARDCFVNDPAENGDKWITVDLADYGKDNTLALSWNGFNVKNMLILTSTTPRENAVRVRQFAADEGVPTSRIIYDATAGRYFNDYIPEARPYISASKAMGLYRLTAATLKDLCYLRLISMIKKGTFTFSDEVALKTYKHQNLKYNVTVQNEFLEECAVVRFKDGINGRKRLLSKKEMNAKLGKGRSMDFLDPCAMRMMPCIDLEYGEELQDGFKQGYEEEEKSYYPFNSTSIYDETIWY